MIRTCPLHVIPNGHLHLAADSIVIQSLTYGAALPCVPLSFRELADPTQTSCFVICFVASWTRRIAPSHGGD
jgi:hypothetical protein